MSKFLSRLARNASRAPLHVVLIAGGLMLSTSIAAPGLAAPRSQAAEAAPVEIDHAVNMIGFGSAKPGSSGHLRIDANAITLEDSQVPVVIPLAAVRAYSIEHINKGLMRGTAGTLAGFAPQGMGQLYSAFRPGAEALNLLYEDANHGLHTAVLMLPKDSKEQAVRAMAVTGLDPDPGLDSDEKPLVYRSDAPMRVEFTPVAGSRSDIRVMMPQATAQNVPTAYIAGAYEAIIDQLSRSGTFGTVWRENDVRGGPDVQTLALTVTTVRKGSAGIRGALPVVGMFAGKTLVVADIRYTDAAGSVLLAKTVKGSKRTPGENMTAVNSLAHRVSAALKQAPREVPGSTALVANRY